MIARHDSFPQDAQSQSEELHATSMGYGSRFDPGYLVWRVEQDAKRKKKETEDQNSGVERGDDYESNSTIAPTTPRGVYEELTIRDPSRSASQARAIGGLASRSVRKGQK